MTWETVFGVPLTEAFISKAESEEMVPDINTVGPNSLRMTRSESPELVDNK